MPPCHTRTTVESLLDLRLQTFLRDNEEAVTNHWADKVRCAGPVWRLDGHDVCRRFWYTAVGVSENKAKHIRTQAQMGPSARARPKSHPLRKREKYLYAYSFWDSFMSTCQTPNNEVRLFPTNKTFDQIWTDIFEPWYARSGHPAKGKPSRRLWERVRWDEDFQDVKKRAKHHHLRCPTCDELRTRSLALFSSGETRAQYEKDERAHRAANQGWRKLETTLSDQARQNP